jgi:COMM domain
MFGDAVAGVIEGQLNSIRKAALIRTVFSGQDVLVDYNWSVKAISGSDQLRQQTLHIVSIEFLIQDKNSKLKRQTAEFSEEEFTKFYHHLTSVQN